MAIPTTISGASSPGNTSDQYQLPPMLSSGGNVYYVGKESSGSTPEVYKATDPTSSFTAQDTSNNPTAVPVSMSATQDGDTIHIVTFKNSSTHVQYHQFSMSSDTWVVTDEAIEDLGKNAPTVTRSVSVITRASGNPVLAAYAGQMDTNMGTDYLRIDYASRVGTNNWTLHGLAFGSSGNLFNWYGCTLGPSSGTQKHIFSSNNDTTRVTAGKTIDSSNGLSTVRTIAIDVQVRHARPHYVLDGATHRIVLVGHVTTTGVTTSFTAGVFRATEDGSGNMDTGLAVTTAGDNTGDAFVLNPLVASGLNGSTVYILFAKSSDNDLYYDSAATPFTSWGTDIEHRDAVTITWVWANVYDRSGTKLAMVYDDGGTIKYDEIDIGVAVQRAKLSLLGVGV